MQSFPSIRFHKIISFRLLGHFRAVCMGQPEIADPADQLLLSISNSAVLEWSSTSLLASDELNHSKYQLKCFLTHGKLNAVAGRIFVEHLPGLNVLFITENEII